METLLEKNKLFRFNINLRKLKKNSALKKKEKKCILEDRKIEKSKLVERQGRKAIGPVPEGWLPVANVISERIFMI